jgi:hypothetical protein
MLAMKWLFLLLASFSIFASPREEILQLFDIPANATEQEILAEASRLWMQQGKERWEFESRYENFRPQLWPLFRTIGMVDEIKPTQNHYESVVILGALLTRVQDRIDYLVSSGVTYDQIIFLTGARPLLDSEKKHLPDLKTEAEMMRWVYENSPLSKTIAAIWVDVPMKGTQRPNTYDTVLAWLEMNPHPDSCLAISNQPYINYQEAVLKRYIPFPLDVAGPAVLGTPTVALMLDTLGREWHYNYGDPRWLNQ